MSAYKVISAVKGYKEATNLIKVLSVLNNAFPNLSSAITDVKNAFVGSGGGLKGALSATKSSALGLWSLIKAHPFATVATAITVASVALQMYRKSQEKYQESLRETISTADENIQKYTDEKNSLLSLQSRLEDAKNDKAKLLSIQDELNKAIGETPGLVQNEGNAYDKASAKIQARIKELDELAKKEAQNKINAQKEIFRTNTTPYKLGTDNLANVGLDIDIQDAVDELNRLKAERQKLIDIGAKEDSIGITDYDKKIARYTQILQGKVKEAKEVFADYIDTEFNDDISKSYANKYIDTLIFGGEDDLDNIQGKIDEIKPKIEQFNDLKNKLLDLQVDGKNTDEIATEIQGLIDEIKKASPEVAELMLTSLNSLVPSDETVNAGIEKIKEAFKKAFGKEEQSTFNNWINTLSDEDKEIIYKISCETDTAKYSLKEWQDVLNGYKVNVDEAKEQYYGILEEIQEKNVDVNKTVFGNIDTNNRQILKWNDANLEKYKNALMSWYSDETTWKEISDEMRNSISTVFGASTEFDGIDIAFSPILQTENGAELLDSDTVNNYIRSLIDMAGEGWTNEDLLRLDAEGLEIDGKKIKGLIADIGEEAKKTSEIMHYVGKDGALNLAYNDYYKTLANNVKNNLDTLWNSEDFNESKTSLIEMADTVEGISPKKIKELAEESEELAEILKLDGMNAEFLANIFQYMATGNDGLSLITEDALKLNEALSGMTEAFDSVSDAKNRYDELMSANEKDTNFKSMAEAFEVLNQQFVEGKTNSNAFWAAAEYLFGSEQIALWGDDLDAIYNAMSKNVSIFKDADSAGFGFLDRLYAMSEAGQVLDDAGNVIAEISKLSDGSYDIDIDYENIDKIADSMDLSRDAVLSCLEAISMFGDIDFYDIEEVAKVIEEIGIATEISGEKAVNVDKLIEHLVNLGKSNKEIVDIVEDLEELDNITLISADMEVNDLIGSLETLGMVAKDGTTIEIEYTALTDLMKEIGFTKEQAETLITKLGEVDGIQFTNQLGSGSGGVTDVQGVLDHINTMDFSSAESEVDTVTSAVQGLTDTLNVLNGKSISVTIDVVGSAKQAVSDIKGLLGFAKGTDNAPEGAALVGEEGEELVQSGNRAYLVGTNGAEIVNLKQGDRVYTASETKKIKSSGKRLIGSIPAFNGGGTYGTISKNTYKSVLPDNSPSKSSNKSSSSSKSSSKSSEKEEKEPQIFDWIEIALSRIQRAIDNLSKKAESTFKKLSTRLSATNKEISKVNEEINLQQKAADRYMKEANNVGLSEGLKEKVRIGSIQISEYDEDTQKLIKDYQEWYEKALDCEDAIDDLHESLASLYEDNFNNVKDDFENQLELAEHLTNQYETGIDMLEAKGYLESTKYYAALQDVTKGEISILNKELASLEKSFSDAMNSGEIERYSESWYSMQSSINGVKEELAEANVELAEYAKTMREIEWGYFAYTQERISQLTQETDFLIDLMSNSDLHTDKGQLTDEGMATMGLHGQNYNTYMAQADMYAQEILEIDKELAKDPYNTELIEYREELLGLQQDSILAAEDEKQAIVALVEEGINLELQAMQDLIDKYTESLDTAKD